MAWYKERIEELGEDYDPSDKEAAMTQALTKGEKFPIGILYQTEPKPAFGHAYRAEITDGPLAEMPPMDEKKLKEILGM